MRRQLIAAALVGTLALVGCTSQPAETVDDAPAVKEEAVEEEEPEEVVEEEPEPEAKTSAVGEPIDYAANAGGTFVVTADGFEWSAEAASMGGVSSGYLECYLLLTVENAGVDTSSNSYIELGRYEKAENCLLRALDLRNDNPWIYTSLSRLYQKIENWDKALEAGWNAVLYAGEAQKDQHINFGLSGFCVELNGIGFFFV